MKTERQGLTGAPLPTLDLGLPGWTLRAWRQGDAAALALHADNPNVWRWMSDNFPQPYTREIAEHWVTRGHVEFGGDHWAIVLDDEAVGGCGIAPLGGPEKAGFAREAVQRQSAIKAGRVIDRHVFVRLREP